VHRLTVLPELTKWSIIFRQAYMVCVHPRPFLKPNWLSPVLSYTKSQIKV